MPPILNPYFLYKFWATVLDDLTSKVIATNLLSSHSDYRGKKIGDKLVKEMVKLCEEDLKIMKRDIQVAKSLGANCIVLGILELQ